MATPNGPASPLTRRLEQFGEAPFAIVLRAKELPASAATGRTTWFGRKIGWFDPERVMGAHLGVTADR